MTSHQAQVDEINSHVELEREIRRYVLGYARKRLPVNADEIENELNEARALEARWMRDPNIGCAVEDLVRLTIALEILAGEVKPRRKQQQQLIKTVEERTALVSARVKIPTLNDKLRAVAAIPEAKERVEQELAKANSQYAELQSLTTESFEASEKRKAKLTKSIETLRGGLISNNPDGREAIWQDINRVLVAIDQR